MLTAFPVSIAIGILLGFLTGLGTGGGSLLLLWLTLVCNMDPLQAKSINLLFFLPAALCATLTRSCRGDIPWKKLWIPILTGCLTAALLSLCTRGLNTQLLQKIFGGLLIAIGLRELFYREGGR
jgi:uncharacterized membrane protein YfcA